MSELDDLCARLDRLESDNAALRAELAALRAGPPPRTVAAMASTPVEAPETAPSRRQMLRVAGAAAAGALGAGVVLATPAAADDGVAVTATTPLVTGTPVRSTFTGSTAGVTGFLFESAAVASGSNGSPNAGAIAGVAHTSGKPANGVYAASDKPNGYGVYAEGTHTLAGGVFGDGSAVGVYGSSNFGIGVVASGARAGLQLINNNATVPPLRSDSHAAGEIDIDTAGSVWVCVDPGTPGLWRKLAGTTAAGAFHPIDPIRVFDSRLGAYGASAGLLVPNAIRVISVADARNAAGQITVTDAVPVGATAIAYNLTVTGTTGPNYLGVTPGDAAFSTTSSINWSAAGQSLANGLVIALSVTRTIKLWCGDQSGSTHAIIDVLGYYR